MCRLDVHPVVSSLVIVTATSSSKKFRSCLQMNYQPANRVFNALDESRGFTTNSLVFSILARLELILTDLQHRRSTMLL